MRVLFKHHAAVWLSAALLTAGVASGQTKAQKAASGYDRSARATVLHEAVVYVQADPSTQRISLVTPGHEVVIMQRSGPWLQVFANTDAGDEAQEDDSDKPEFGDDNAPTPESGWIRNKGIVSPSTPGGDMILFGAAANMEAQAEQPHAPKGAAEAAHLLYKRVPDYFPNSPLAAEAAWRAADIRWQLDKIDISTLPSAKEQAAYLRPQVYEGAMKRVMKNYPGTNYAARAAYDLIDNKLCGDWQGLPKCPEMETGLYEKYARQYPDSPKAPEALYNATYRQGVLVTMFMVQDDEKKADDAAKHVADLAQQMQQQFPKSDYTARAAAIAYKVQQKVPVYGSDRD